MLSSRPLILAAFVFVLCLGAGAGARAQTTRLYLASYMGLNLYNAQDFSESSTASGGKVNYKNAISFAGALGVRLNRDVRIEGEISYRNATVHGADFNSAVSGSVHTTLAMANIYYDLNMLNWKNVTPFVTAGIGVASNNLSIDGGSGLPAGGGRSLGFAYQAGAGLMYRVSPTLAFTGDYKYLGTSNMDAGGYGAGYHSHEIRLGLQYDLPAGFLN